MRFAKWTFNGAGIYGVLFLAPMLFMERRIGVELPPALNHPEYFYGFLVVGLAWQAAFLAIGRDPVALRPLMLPALLEKFGGLAAFTGLWLAGRVPAQIGLSGLLDGAWGLMFLVAYLRTGTGSGSIKA